MSPSPHIDALRVARTLRGYADGLAADKNEALFFIHSALLARFSRPRSTIEQIEDGLRSDIDRHAARATAARTFAGDPLT